MGYVLVMWGAALKVVFPRNVSRTCVEVILIARGHKEEKRRELLWCKSSWMKETALSLRALTLIYYHSLIRIHYTKCLI